MFRLVSVIYWSVTILKHEYVKQCIIMHIDSIQSKRYYALNLRLNSKSTLDLNLKEVELEWWNKIFVCTFIVLYYTSSKISKVKFEFCQIK